MKWRTVLLCAVLLPVAGHVYMHTFCSRQRLFNRITIGESENEVKKILRSGEITWFEKSTSPIPGNYNYSVYYFQDDWRVYQVEFNPVTHTVAATDFTYNPAPHTAIQEIDLRVYEWCHPNR